MVECHFRDGPAKDKIISTQVLEDIICVPEQDPFTNWLMQESSWEPVLPKTVYYRRVATCYSLDMKPLKPLKPLKAWYTSNA